MKKNFRSFYLLGMAAMAALLTVSCSDNDTAVDNNGEGGVENAASYLNVKINYAGVTSETASGVKARTRTATVGDYEKYSYDEIEHRVSSICALFFTNDGSYLTAGQKVLANETGNSDEKNIESAVGAVLALGPTTIKPTDKIKMLLFVNDKCSENWFQSGSKVSSFSSLIGKNYDEVLALTTNKEITANSNAGDFEMTNSAYVDGSGKVVQAVIVDGYEFKSTETEAIEGNAVTAYVERTVAKVYPMGYTSATNSISLGNKIQSNSAPFVIGNSYYFPIMNKDNTSAPMSFSVDGTSTAFAVKVLGSIPNGVNKEGYLVKQITNNNDCYTLFDNIVWPVSKWSSFTDFRSYWAEDVNYSDGTECGKKTESSLNFKTFSDASSGNATQYYIYENTVEQKNAQYKGDTQHPNVTTMLVAAQILPLKGSFAEGSNTNFTFADGASVDKESNLCSKAVNMYRYQGAFYKNISDIENSVLKDYYYYDSSASSYTQVTDSWISDNISYDTDNTVNDGTNNGKSYNGIIRKVSFSSENTKLYSDGEGKTEAKIDDINNKLAETFISDKKIEYFKDGKCFYQVPIEQPSYTDDNNNTYSIYGVVRNHSYQLTLNSIGSIGAPYTGTDEEIELIPGEDTYYYLGCSLNVLAWRIVKQSVNL